MYGSRGIGWLRDDKTRTIILKHYFKLPLQRIKNTFKFKNQKLMVFEKGHFMTSTVE